MMSKQANKSLSSLAGKQVVVTGANRGIGLAITRALLAQGAHVTAGCRHPERADALNELKKEAGDALQVGALDVTKAASVAQFAASVPSSLDILFNNAGINVDSGETPLSIAAEKLEQSFATNTLGPLRMVQALQPRLAKARGKVVNISSIMGSIADNEMGGNTAYRVSKTALNMLNKNLALADSKVTYLTMHPGWVQTDMGGPKAPVKDQESAHGILSVVTKATEKDSGSFIRFDGSPAAW